MPALRRSHLLAASNTGVSTVRRSQSASAASSVPMPALSLQVCTNYDMDSLVLA